MKRIICISIGFLILGLKLNATPVDSMYYGAFGKVTIYLPANVPDAVVLFVSGDGGWNKGVVDMAKNIVTQSALVAGIDIRHYFKSIKSMKSKCHYPAGDFEELSLTIQKKYKLNQYLKPILVGYSSGATLVYGILAQAPANTFKGAISLGFCPDIEIDKPLCNGSGLTTHVLKEGIAYYLEPCRQLTAPFIVLEGMIDQVCSYADTKKYMEDIPLGEFISLPDVGHGFSVPKNWMPQYISAYQKVLKEPGYVEKITAQNTLLQSQHLAPLNSTLPLTLIPSSAKENLPLAFFISGDGGWTSFDQAVCEKLAENGMPVIGLDAQKYFWNEKQPKEASDEMAKAVEHYMQQWNRNSFVLIGYSFGACVAPFIANNFSAPLKETLKGVYCFSPDETGDFEIHISDMLNFKNNEKYNVLDELKKIKSLNPVCIFGNEEDIELRNHFSATGIRVITLPGNHHYENDYNAVAETIHKDFFRGN
jgi:type IV secretory pathway VirJ component